ncbi:MAG: carboxypeptidase-like regulatory domain-containing protein, partial [Bacteroidales bacterium]|nr:carboxypeptidase-like regulatory domain-containing protein [Candidatus Cryptobacteroides caccocaballi]
MKKIILTILIGTLMPAAIFAADDWKGKVIDEKGEPVPYANVVILSAKDSTVVAGTTTSDDGSFNIKTDGKDQILMVAMIGYKTEYLNSIDNTSITLMPDTEYLDGALVSVVVPKTTLTGEGLKTAVRGSVLEDVGTANDVLA